MTNVLGLGKAVDFTLSAMLPGSVCHIFPLLLLMVSNDADCARGGDSGSGKLRSSKAVAGMTGRNMDPYMGRAFVAMGWRRCFLALSAVAA